jgi:hypothetical protein
LVVFTRYARARSREEFLTSSPTIACMQTFISEQKVPLDQELLEKVLYTSDKISIDM